MKSALIQLVEPFMPTEGVPKRKEYLNSHSEGSFYTLSKLWKKLPQTEFSGRGLERFLYKVELRSGALAAPFGAIAGHRHGLLERTKRFRPEGEAMLCLFPTEPDMR